jgi:hypothetical protein
MQFRKGFLYKEFTFKQIEIDSMLRPRIHEVKKFTDLLH